MSDYVIKNEKYCIPLEKISRLFGPVPALESEEKGIPPFSYELQCFDLSILIVLS